MLFTLHLMYIVSNVTKNISEEGFLCKYNFIVPRCLCRNIIVDLQKVILVLQQVAV